MNAESEKKTTRKFKVFEMVAKFCNKEPEMAANPISKHT